MSINFSNLCNSFIGINLNEYAYLISIVLSIILGFIIGIERKTRSKEAGIRTHAIVCFGAALMMVVSKYGFSGMDADASRIASQIVTGVGFLGAGMIVYRKRSIYGLTTAAGVWATAGIGMACGAELYLVAIVSTALLIALQCILHIKCKLFSSKRSYDITICFKDIPDACDKIKEIFHILHFNKIITTRTTEIIYTVYVNTEVEITSNTIRKILKENEFITSITRCDEVY